MISTPFSWRGMLHLAMQDERKPTYQLSRLDGVVHVWAGVSTSAAGRAATIPTAAKAATSLSRSLVMAGTAILRAVFVT